MLNIPELERRWKSYRRKKRLPYYIGITVFLGIAVLVAVVSLKSMQTVPSQKPLKPDTPPAAITTEKSTEIPSAASPVHVPEASNPEPAQSVIRGFESEVIDYYAQTATEASQPPKNVSQQQYIPSKAPLVQNSMQPPVQQSTSQPVKKHTLPAIQEAPEEIVVNPLPAKEEEVVSVSQESPVQRGAESGPTQTGDMQIQRESDMKDIQDVIARFKMNKNPALSLFIAKRYYQIGNYQQAYNYALITNELDNNIEDSWLIFAKSLYKLDQKKMALKTLDSYLKESGSVKAKITLDQMRNGTFE